MAVFPLLVAVAAPARAETTGRILVSLRPDAAGHAAAVAAAAAARLDGAGAPQIAMVAVRPRAGIAERVVLRLLRRDTRVRAAAPEGRFELRYEPDDTAMHVLETDAAAPAGTPLQWALGRHGFPRAWDVTRGSGAVVAVIDTGADASHPDLDGKIAAAIDLDDDPSAPATTDRDGHGTHVGSLACGATDNGFGIAGAGFDCRLLVISTDLTDGSVARGIVAAADAGAHSLNMSFGDEGTHASPAIADAVRYAVDRGVVLVAAAADEPVSEQGEPANLLQPAGTGPDLKAGLGLSVTAATIDGRRAEFAGHGGQVSLAAYGALFADGGETRGLIGAYPAGPTPRERHSVLPPSHGCGCRQTLDGLDSFAVLAGTSMAAPQVAAAAALVRRLNPDLSAREVVRIMKATARRPSHARWNPDLGWGLLDAGAAIAAARRVDRRPPWSRAQAAARRRAAARIRLRLRGADRRPAGLVPSGVARFEIHRSVDGGPPRRIATTSARRRTVRVRPGRGYAFFSVAVDRAGNREPLPERPDVRFFAP